MDDSVDWRKLREFTGVDLTQSFVLSWSVEGDTLCIELDLHLTPKHPFYEKPRPAEKVCIRPAVIEFPYCETLTLNGTGGGEAIDAVAAKIGLGPITGLVRRDEGPFELDGKFGRVSISRHGVIGL